MTDDTFLGFGRTTSTTLSLLNASNFDLIHFKVPAETPKHAEQGGLAFVLQLVACCDSFQEDGEEIPLIEVGPYLMEFLVQAQSCVFEDPADHSLIKINNNNNNNNTTTSPTIAVQVGPMSILPEFFSSSQSLIMTATRVERQIQELPLNSTLALTCIYVDDDTLSDEISNNNNNNNNNNTTTNDMMILTQMIRSSLQGRLIMSNTVMELSLEMEQSNVRAFVTVESIKTTSEKDGHHLHELSAPTVAFRIASEDTFSVQLVKTTPRTTTTTTTTIESSYHDNTRVLPCPGYELMVHQLVQLLSMQSIAARPTAVLLTGCAGVGKTFMAACIQSTLLHQQQQQQQHQKDDTSRIMVHWISIQDLRMQSHGIALAAASNESNIIRSCLPSQHLLLDHQQGRLRLVVILDDLHLFHPQTQQQQEEGGVGPNVILDLEGLVLSNAIQQVIDILVEQHVPILGITRLASQLPLEFLRAGRFEKEIMVPPPGQAQREAIWKYLFQSFAKQQQQQQDGEDYDNWALALSPMTIGFVPLDMCQVFASAWTLGKVASTTQDGNEKVALSWEHLVTAVQGFVPSQLRNVDLVKPTFFPLQNNNHSTTTTTTAWMEIHEQSWKSFGGNAKMKQRMYRTVVSPWRRLLMALEKQHNESRMILHDNSSPPQVKNNVTMMVHPPSGVLFHGPSGTGKTLAAECLASSMGLPTLKVRPFQVLDKWLGGSEAILRSLFARARSVAPCILFLDEIDAIATNRSADDGGNDLMSRLLSTLLNEMDGVSSGLQHGVLVVACTNRMNTLDSALLRPGRLEEHILLDLPNNATDIVEIMKVHLAKVPFANDIPWESIGERLVAQKCTAADVEGICREACSLALDRFTATDKAISELTLTLQDLEDVMMTV